MTSEGEGVSVNHSTNEAYETRMNKLAAMLSILYLLLSLIFIGWQLFDVWIGQHSLARWVRYELEPLNTPTFRLIFFTVMGGGLGGIVNGIRSALTWYPDFDRRYAWKYVMAPWLGAALALLVYALLNSGVSVFGGGSISDVDATRILAMFSTGALAGYGARDVFIWLDAQVSRLFNPEETPSGETSKVAETTSGEAVPLLEEVDSVANAESDLLVLDEPIVDVIENVTVDPTFLRDVSGSESPTAV